MRPERAGRIASTTGVQRLLLACVAACVLVAGCNRLTFIKQDYGREGFERTAPELDINTDPRGSGEAKALLEVRRGQQLLREGHVEQAGDAAEKALELDGNSAAAHTLMALVADRSGRSDLAGKHYKRAVDLAPRRGATLNNYGTWLCQNGGEAESIEWFQRAIAAPGYDTPAAAAANAGSCAQQAGKSEQAVMFLQAALKVDPENPVALLAMASHEFQAGRAFHARAFSQRRLDAAPATPAALRLASQIEQKLGDTEAAARYVQRLRAEFPDSTGSGIGEDGKR